MAKASDLLSRFGSNLAESMGAGRAPSTMVPGGAASGFQAPSGPSRHDGVNRLKAAAEIAIDRVIADPNQPRTEFDPQAIERLAQSIRDHGQLQPITVRWDESLGRYLIVAGERRWRASQLALRPSIACVILDGEASNSRILEMQLIENALREDLQPIEQARAFKTLMDMNDWSAGRLARALSLNDSTVIRALALLDLPCTVQDRVADGSLAPSVGYEISKIDDPDRQRDVADRVVAQGLTRAETIEAVRRESAGRPGLKKAKGRGGVLARARKPIARTIRVPQGRVVVELRKGLEEADLVAALHAALDALEGRAQNLDAA